MSDFSQPNPSMPPPPPPGGGQPPPYGGAPGPAPAFGAPGQAVGFPAAPSGFTAYEQRPAVQLAQPAGLRKATVVLCWVVTALTVVLGVVAFNRGSVAQNFLDGSARLSEVDDADSAVAGGVGLVLMAMLATAIVICVWSVRSVRNAKGRDPLNPGSPGLAGGGWFIPIAFCFVSFQQFRASTRRFGANIPALMGWQVAFGIAWVLLIVQRIQGNVTISNLADSGSRLHAQGVIILLAAVALAVSTVFATKAMRRIDAVNAGAS